ncbi:unnamed protein product, partial [Staurois parvus]
QVIWLDSGHRVTWHNRIIRLDQFIRLGTDIRLGTRLNHGRRVLRRQADRFGYWQDGTGWKEFSLFSGFSYWSTVSKRRSVNE